MVPIDITCSSIHIVCEASNSAHPHRRPPARANISERGGMPEAAAADGRASRPPSQSRGSAQIPWLGPGECVSVVQKWRKNPLMLLVEIRAAAVRRNVSAASASHSALWTPSPRAWVSTTLPNSSAPE